jgi:hypothetical protein
MKFRVALTSLMVAFALTASVLAACGRNDNRTNGDTETPRSGKDANPPDRPGTKPTAKPKKRKPCPPKGSKAVNFSAYYVGDELAGLPLTDISRVCNEPYPGEPVRGNYVSFIYGDCTPGTDSGCAPPLEVQTAPACERNASLYSPHFPRKRLRLRGVPGAYFAPLDERLELYTGDATVVIFGRERKQVFAAARALRSVPTFGEPAGCSGERRSSSPSPRSCSRQASMLRLLLFCQRPLSVAIRGYRGWVDPQRGLPTETEVMRRSDRTHGPEADGDRA